MDKKQIKKISNLSKVLTSIWNFGLSVSGTSMLLSLLILINIVNKFTMDIFIISTLTFLIFFLLNYFFRIKPKNNFIRV